MHKNSLASALNLLLANFSEVSETDEPNSTFHLEHFRHFTICAHTGAVVSG
jgi:hypothetical protein